MNGEAVLASGGGGGSEFSDSSSSVSIDDFPANNTAGLLTLAVTTTRKGSSQKRHLTPTSPTTIFEAEQAGTMVTLMEASDCEDFPGIEQLPFFCFWTFIKRKRMHRGLFKMRGGDPFYYNGAALEATMHRCCTTFIMGELRIY